LNLHDLVRRGNRDVQITGEAEPLTPRVGGGRVRAVRLGQGARLRILRANELTSLAGFPTDLRWRVLGRWPAGGIRVRLKSKAGKAVLGTTEPDLANPKLPVLLNWPVAAASEEFDLIIEQTGRMPALVDVGPNLNPRSKLLPLIRGVGVEVGPGLHPHVRPGADVDVYYVEEKSPEEWRDTYAHGRKARAGAALGPEIIERTHTQSAYSLEQWAPGSLDFIFSNHVFEHLMNPLQVLRNWLSRLRPGGIVVGVTPDARYCFDRRQPLSSLADFREESAAGTFEPPEEKYERWIRYTQPNRTIAKLKKHRYSIHMHYYTPEIFRLLAEELKAEGLISTVFLNTAPNNKDFGFVLTKAA
jgi:SAM-dependent methyltransferase